jgi:hypothetical protein
MKKLYIISILALLSMKALGQEEENGFNFIIVVDDNVWLSYTNLKVEIRGADGSVIDKVSGVYYPGNLFFEKEDYEKLMNAETDSMTLIFNYKESQGKKEYDYELPFFKSWLDHYFMVMKVYNLDKRKYKGVFEPLDKDRNYTYELNYPGGSMLRVRNKVKKKNCD